MPGRHQKLRAAEKLYLAALVKIKSAPNSAIYQRELLAARRAYNEAAKGYRPPPNKPL